MAKLSLLTFIDNYCIFLSSLKNTAEKKSLKAHSSLTFQFQVYKTFHPDNRIEGIHQIKRLDGINIENTRIPARWLTWLIVWVAVKKNTSHISFFNTPITYCHFKRFTANLIVHVHLKLPCFEITEPLGVVMVMLFTF